jgi:16S rRNA (cytosine1402-N4)-methyltransferase
MAGAAHKPVLLDEALAALQIGPDGWYVDGTFGRGGHAGAILARLEKSGRLIAIDRDEDAVEWGRRQFGTDSRFSIVRGSFDELASITRAHDVFGRVNGLLLDLGVSSPQLDEPRRGFSFLRDGDLDMRMDRRQSQTAAQWLARAGEREISDVLHRYGEERYARRIARAIVTARAQAPIKTTGRLAEIIAAANPAWEEGKHPATRSFQAIRIFINRELEALERCLDQSIEVLGVGGRVAVITFHSLEDRLVKRFFRDAARGDPYPKGVPVPAGMLHPRLRVVGKAITPSPAEIGANPRARSARLRTAERLS